MLIRNLGLLAAALALVACAPPVQHHTHHEAHTVVALKDGRYGYQDDGIWYYWMLTNAMSSSSTSNASPIVTASGGSVSLPAGGAWTKGSAPTSEEVNEAELAGETEVAENEVGEPTSEAAAESSSDTSSTSSDSSSSSSDSSGSE